MNPSPTPQVALAGHLDEAGVSDLRPFQLGTSAGMPAGTRAGGPRRTTSAHRHPRGHAGRGWRWLSRLLAAAALVLLWQQLTTPGMDAPAEPPAADTSATIKTRAASAIAATDTTATNTAAPASRRPAASARPQAERRAARPPAAPASASPAEAQPATPLAQDSVQNGAAAPSLDTLRRLQQNM